MPAFIDLTGRKFGRLTVLSRAGDTKHKHPQWNCQCDCGAMSVVRGQSLRAGTTVSCGCFGRDQKGEICRARATHGHSSRTKQTRAYTAWVGMLQRCTNPSNPKFYLYGGRGITVCRRWQNDFANFLADMGEPPVGLTLDRKDVNGHYEPGNCRWASQREQQNNRSNNRRIEWRGQNLTIHGMVARHRNSPPHDF